MSAPTKNPPTKAAAPSPAKLDFGTLEVREAPALTKETVNSLAATPVPGWVREARAAQQAGKPASRSVTVPGGSASQVENLLRLAAKQAGHGMKVHHWQDGKRIVDATKVNKAKPVEVRYEPRDAKKFAPYEKTECPRCGKTVTKTKDGTIRKHTNKGGQPCE